MAPMDNAFSPNDSRIVFSDEAKLGFFVLFPDLRCCLGRRLAFVRPKDTDSHSHFRIHQFISQDFQSRLMKNSVQGAIVDRIPLIHFPGFSVLNLPLTLKQSFESQVSLLGAKIHTKVKEPRTRADTLLPKPLSGELSFT